MSSTDNTQALDSTVGLTEIDQQESTSSHAAKEAGPHCDRCERRKIRERGYAREARLRKKLAAQSAAEVKESVEEHGTEE